ncbi:MAG: diguanylate cyclase domain-containing protein, partial [Pontibacterium sp.]
SIGDAIKQPMNTDYGKLSVSTSIGIAFYPKNGHSISELMTAADKAMYAAKQSGRCVSCA